MIEVLIDKLITMKLSGMAEGIREQGASHVYRDLSFEERLGLLVDKEKLHRENRQVKILLAHAHLRHLNPLPANTEEILRSYKRVLVPEVNMGQLSLLLRAKFLIDVLGFNRVRGKPFRIIEIKQAAEELLGQE